MDKVFAPEYPRTDEGWLQFPNDVAWRKQLFHPGVFKHPAKLQMYLCWELVKYLTEPGDIILDPMSGTGTIMMAAQMGRRVICIEIEEPFHKLQHLTAESVAAGDGGVRDLITMIHGNCTRILPLPCNHIIFSPPYASALKPSKTASKFVMEKYHQDEDEYAAYAQTQGNVGLVNTFLYNQMMEKVYGLCYKSVVTGGTMSVVTKDITENGVRVLLSKWIVKVCTAAGFTSYEWYKHKLMGGAYQDIRRNAGLETVDDEDILIFHKE